MFAQSVISKRDVLFLFQPKKSAWGKLLSRKQGLGTPVHVKMQCILIDVDHYTLLVLGGSNTLPLLLIPSWTLTIAYWNAANTFAYAYAYSHLPMPMPWAGPLPLAHVLGPLRPPDPFTDGPAAPAQGRGAWARPMAWA